MPFYILVSGVSRAGKSYFCDALSEARPQFTHVPLDKYIKPVPPGFSLSEWFFTPACIDWDLLQTHLDILQSGSACYTPQGDWNDRGRRLSAGGPAGTGQGRLMRPAETAYLLPGNHAFYLPVRRAETFRVFVDTPEAEVARRMLGAGADGRALAEKIDKDLARKRPAALYRRALADFVLNGTLPPAEQADRFLTAFRRHFSLP